MGFDQLADALGHQARRQILVELMEHNPVSESGLEGSGVSGIELIHSHLPKLDEMDYIVWDRESQTIMKGPIWEEIEPVVRLLRDNPERIPIDTFQCTKRS
jgi:hypothetical protein